MICKIKLADPLISGVYPVAIAPAHVMQAIGANTKVVRLSYQDKNKQLGKVHEQGRNQYVMLQEMISKGEIIQYRARAVAVYFEINGQLHHAALQATKAGHEVYLKSLRRSDNKQLLRDRIRGKIISAD